MSIIAAGDIFSTKGKGISGWLSEHGTKTLKGSHTNRFHFGIIADPIYSTSGKIIDYETRESISKGPSTLRFFEKYNGKDIELYRISGLTKDEGLQLVRSISEIGDKSYGYKDIAIAAWDVFCLFMTMQFPPYTALQFKESSSDTYICTEIPAYGARKIGRPLESDGWEKVWVIPVVYLQAIEEGRLIKYYKGNVIDLKNLYYKDES